MAEPTAPEAKKPEEGKQVAKKEAAFITLWFDDQGGLKFKSTGLTIYAIIGVLRASIKKFEDSLGAGGKEPPEIKPPAESAPGA